LAASEASPAPSPSAPKRPSGIDATTTSTAARLTSCGLPEEAGGDRRRAERRDRDVRIEGGRGTPGRSAVAARSIAGPPCGSSAGVHRLVVATPHERVRGRLWRSERASNAVGSWRSTIREAATCTSANPLHPARGQRHLPLDGGAAERRDDDLAVAVVDEHRVPVAHARERRPQQRVEVDVRRPYSDAAPPRSASSTSRRA
jgi:hypothetical protein